MTPVAPNSFGEVSRQIYIMDIHYVLKQYEGKKYMVRLDHKYNVDVERG